MSSRRQRLWEYLRKQQPNQWGQRLCGLWLHDLMTFRVFTAVKIQAEIFWAVTPGTVVVEYQRFGGHCCLHLQGEDSGNMETTWAHEF
jgi:hypothetical protein